MHTKFKLDVNEVANDTERWSLVQFNSELDS